MELFDTLVESSLVENLFKMNERLSKTLIRQGRVIEFQRNEKLFDISSKQFFMAILEGTAKVSMVHSNGGRSIIHFARTGDFIGELELLDNNIMQHEVVAQSTVRCLAIPMAECRRLIDNDSSFALLLSRYLANKLYQRTIRLSEASNFKLKYRLCAFVAETMVDCEYYEKNTEAAEYLNVSYRHLTYTLKELQDEGILVKHKKYIEITDKKKLRDYAKEITGFC